MKTYRDTVIDELDGKATSEEVEELNDDPAKWHSELAVMKRELDSQMVSMKASSLTRGRGGFLEFTRFKSVAVPFMKKVDGRLQITKMLKHEQNRKADAELGSIDEEMLAELKGIRALLEKLVSAGVNP